MIFILIGIIGLSVGSFLNVVIARYPVMLMQKWGAECREFLKLPASPRAPTLNLAVPRSHCPHCEQRLPFWQNIPLISYFALRGQCGFCQKPIALQYPLIELITALATVAVFIQWGWQIKTIALWLMTWGLIVLSGIDWKTQILPDDITLSLLWIGLLCNIHALFVPLSQAVLGATLGYILLWGVAQLFKLIRKKQGMGHGDFKMLAMFGAWLGVAPLLYLLLMAIFLSLMANLSLLALKKIRLDQPLPFGPWLAMAGWIIFMSGAITTGMTQWL